MKLSGALNFIIVLMHGNLKIGYGNDQNNIQRIRKRKMTLERTNVNYNVDGKLTNIHSTTKPNINYD